MNANLLTPLSVLAVGCRDPASWKWIRRRAGGTDPQHTDCTFVHHCSFTDIGATWFTLVTTGSFQDHSREICGTISLSWHKLMLNLNTNHTLDTFAETNRGQKQIGLTVSPRTHTCTNVIQTQGWRRFCVSHTHTRCDWYRRYTRT